jgi:hypothetical protein
MPVVVTASQVPSRTPPSQVGRGDTAKPAASRANNGATTLRPALRRASGQEEIGKEDLLLQYKVLQVKIQVTLAFDLRHSISSSGFRECFPIISMTASKRSGACIGKKWPPSRISNRNSMLV